MKTLFATLAVLGCVLLLAACAQAPNQPERPRVLLVVPQSQIADIEYLETRAALDAAGMGVSIASLVVDEASGKQVKLMPDMRIGDARADDFNAIVIIGGWGTMYQLWDHAGLHALVREADRKERIVAAICAGPGVLAHAGILQGRDATSSPDYKKGDQFQRLEMTRYGARYRDDKLVVTDGRLITGNGPQSSAEFAATLVQALRLSQR